MAAMAITPQPMGPMATSSPLNAPATHGIAVLAIQPSVLPSPPALIPKVVMAKRANSSGERILANVIVTAPPIVARAIMAAATLAIVPASSGLALIQSPTPRVMAVMFCTSPRKGPSLVSVIEIPTSSQALRRFFKSPPMLSAMVSAMRAFSPMFSPRALMISSSWPPPMASTSSAMPEPASTPKISCMMALRSTLPRSAVAWLMSRRISGMARMLPLASEI